MSSIKYNSTRVNSVVEDINRIANQFSTLSTSMRSATNKIVSAKGFQQYIGGLSSDSFSSYIDQCGAACTNLTRNIRQKEVDILAYSQDKTAINHFLDGLTNAEYQSLDLSSLDSYIGLDRKVGNFFKGIFSSAGTIGLGLVEGVADFGETLMDTAALGLTGAASIFTGGYDLLTGSNTTKQMWEETKAFVSDKKVENAFNRFYNNTEIGQALKNNAYGFDTVRGVGKGLGYTAGVIGLSVVTGGLASGGIGAAGSITPVQLGLTAGTLGFGNGTEEAWADGATLGKGLAYGVAAGAWEGAQWYIGGKINQYGGIGDRVAKGLFKGAEAGVGTRIFMDTVDSGLEGFVQPALTMIYKDYGGANFVDNYKTAFDAAGGWKNVATQAAIGAIGSTIGEFTGARRLLKADDPGDLEDIGKAAGATGVAAAGEGADQIFKHGDVDAGRMDVGDSIPRLAGDTVDDVSRAVKTGGGEAAETALKNLDGGVDISHQVGDGLDSTRPDIDLDSGTGAGADNIFKHGDVSATGGVDPFSIKETTDSVTETALKNGDSLDSVGRQGAASMGGDSSGASDIFRSGSTESSSRLQTLLAGEPVNDKGVKIVPSSYLDEKQIQVKAGEAICLDPNDGNYYHVMKNGSVDRKVAIPSSYMENPSDGSSRLIFQNKNGKNMYVDAAVGSNATYSEFTDVSPGSQGHTHITQGELDIRRDGSYKPLGGHCEDTMKATHPDLVVTRDPMGTASNGVYEGDWSVKAPDGSIVTKHSTFFPESWSRDAAGNITDQRICDAIQEVGKTKPVAINPKKTMSVHHGVVDGVEIVIVGKRNNGNFSSAYPIHPLSKDNFESIMKALIELGYVDVR